MYLLGVNSVFSDFLMGEALGSWWKSVVEGAEKMFLRASILKFVVSSLVSQIFAQNRSKLVLKLFSFFLLKTLDLLSLLGHFWAFFSTWEISPRTFGQSNLGKSRQILTSKRPISWTLGILISEFSIFLGSLMLDMDSFANFLTNCIISCFRFHVDW